MSSSLGIEVVADAALIRRSRGTSWRRSAGALNFVPGTAMPARYRPATANGLPRVTSKVQFCPSLQPSRQAIMKGMITVTEPQVWASSLAR